MWLKPPCQPYSGTQDCASSFTWMTIRPRFVHVEGRGGQAKIALSGPVVVWNRGFTRADMKIRARYGTLANDDRVFYTHGRRYMADLTDEEFDAVQTFRGRSRCSTTEPHARAAFFDRATGSPG